MELRIFIALLGILNSEALGESTVYLPGGGVVGLGQDAVFKYVTDDEWFMCNYYRYEPVKNRDDEDIETEFCSYMNRDGEVSQLKCDPQSLSSHLQYTGTDPKECTITVKNITMEDDVSWAVRLASDLEPTKFNITVAVAMESIAIEAPNSFEAGKPANITCVTVGGSPKPKVVIKTIPDLETPIDSKAIVETSDEGLKQRRFTTTITPGIKDNGRALLCSAQQFDRSPVPKALFGQANAEVVTMNVRYPPQPIGDAPFKATLGEKVLIGITLQSNPAPNITKWTKSSEMNDSGNETTTVDLENGDKYLMGELVDLDNMRYRADLTINNVSEEDIAASYHLILTNSVGSVSYEFKLTERGNIIPAVSNNLTMFVLIGVGCAIILVAIGVALYKKCTTDANETSPLIN